MSFLTLRTPVSSATITSAASRSVPVHTDPVRVMSPSFAVASTPSGSASRHRGRLDVLRIARDVSGEHHVPVHLFDPDI